MEIFDVFTMNGIENNPAAGKIFLENVILKVSQTHFSKDFYPKGGINFSKGGGLWSPLGTQEAIIYRLVLTNPDFGPYLPFCFFGSLKRAWPPQVPLWVWGLKTGPKSWFTWWTFWVTCYLEIMFPTFLTLSILVKGDPYIKIG